MLTVLIVDKTIHPAFQFLSNLEDTGGFIDLVLVDNRKEASKLVNKNKYDLIIFGDRLENGNVYDVAHDVRDSRKNRHTAFVTVGLNRGLRAKILKLLKPYAYSAAPSELAATVTRINQHFERL